MGLFNRTTSSSPETLTEEPKGEAATTAVATAANPSAKRLPTYNHNGHRVTRGIHPDGESGRKGKTSLLQGSSQEREMGASRLVVPPLVPLASEASSLFLQT